MPNIQVDRSRRIEVLEAHRLWTRRQARPQTETDRAPKARGDPPARQAMRAGARDRAELQRLAQHDFAIDGLKHDPGMTL